jgi:diaminopimelate epimerase
VTASPSSAPRLRANGALGVAEFVRSQALGNDYLVVDGERFGASLSPETVRRLCDRHTGLGSDGILERVAPPDGFDAAVRIHNPDGSEAEKSGNGVRIFAKFLVDHGYVAADRVLRIHTLGGAVEAAHVERAHDRSWLRVSMGRASFRCADLPMTGAGDAPDAEWIRRPLRVGDRDLDVTCVSVGNPHAVVFGEPLEEATVRRHGPLLETHELFPQRTNVQLAAVVDRATVRALIWERGAGWTLSSGSSSCAVAAACVRSGLVDRRVRVEMPGGSLEVVVGDDWQLEQIGWAQELAAGRVSADLLAGLGVPAPSGRPSRRGDVR